MIEAPISGINLVLRFFTQELNSFLLMLFTILVPNTHAQSKRTAMKQYLVHPGIRFLLCLETPSVSLWKSTYNWCRSSFTSYIVFYIAVKCVLVFANIVIHPIIDARVGYFIFVDKNRSIFITDINRIKSPVFDFVIESIVSASFNCLPGIIYVIIGYIVFIKIKFWF